MSLPTQICINGETITPQNLAQWKQGKSGILADVADFLEEWYAPQATMPLHTSGSTGKPTCIQAAKPAMVASAELSCRVLGLYHGNTALLCLPMQYIAGKMMVVRALVAGLSLRVTEPSTTPLDALDEDLDFAAMVPLQVSRTLAHEQGITSLGRIRTLLLGGGFIDPALEETLQTLPCHIYASYGMTETLSHIALRRVNGPAASDTYTPLPGVSVRTDDEGVLTLSAQHLGITELKTNDVAEIRENGQFLILGRRDAVINSGGIKIQAEELENRLHAAVRDITVVALAAPHPELGECVALLWEGQPAAEAELLQACDTLPRHHRPHHLLRVELPRTESGKPARAVCRELLPILLAGKKHRHLKGFRRRIIRTLEELQNSSWWEKAKDPTVQAGISRAAELWFRKFGQKSRVARRLNEALKLLKSATGNKQLTTPRNIIILTAVILYTITPLDSIPDIIPVVGWLDDLGLLALAVKTVMDAIRPSK